MKRRPVPATPRRRWQEREFESLLRMAAARAGRIKAAPLRFTGDRKARLAS
jgi:hypothetical protein